MIICLNIYENCSGDSDFGELKGDIAAVADHFRTDLDQLLPELPQQRRCSAAVDNNNGTECPLRVTSRLHGHCVDTSALRAEADVFGGKADVEIEGLLSARERTFSRQAQNVRL